MAEKKLILVLNASSVYIKHTVTDVKAFLPLMNKFFEAMNETYLPLLDMFERMEIEQVPYKVGLVLSPVVCTLLDDAEVQGQYKQWLENRIELGKKELEHSSYSSEIVENVNRCLANNQKAKDLYEKYNGRLLRKFLDFHKKGYVELIATCGTDIFLPHFNDIPEVINAQVETGYFAFKAYFGENPEGFWLPELGYYPGIEKFIKPFTMDMDYFVAHGDECATKCRAECNYCFEKYDRFVETLKEYGLEIVKVQKQRLEV